MPLHADSPIVVYTLLNMATTLFKWSTWERTPTVQLAPTLCLFARVLDRLAAMALGAICIPDNAYLDQPLEVPLEVLRRKEESSPLVPHGGEQATFSKIHEGGNQAVPPPPSSSARIHLLQRPSQKDAVGGLQGSDSHRATTPLLPLLGLTKTRRLGERRSCPQQDLTHCGLVDALEPLAEYVHQRANVHQRASLK